MQFNFTPHLPSPPGQLSVGCYKSKTPLTYLAHVKDPNVVREGGGGSWEENLVKVVFMSAPLLVSCKFHRDAREKGEVSQNLLARIVGL